MSLIADAISVSAWATGSSTAAAVFGVVHGAVSWIPPWAAWAAVIVLIARYGWSETRGAWLPRALRFRDRRAAFVADVDRLLGALEGVLRPRYISDTPPPHIAAARVLIEHNPTLDGLRARGFVVPPPGPDPVKTAEALATALRYALPYLRVDNWATAREVAAEAAAHLAAGREVIG